jgi:hypothetical protein
MFGKALLIFENSSTSESDESDLLLKEVKCPDSLRTNVFKTVVSEASGHAMPNLLSAVVSLIVKLTQFVASTESKNWISYLQDSSVNTMAMTTVRAGTVVLGEMFCGASAPDPRVGDSYQLVVQSLSLSVDLVADNANNWRIDSNSCNYNRVGSQTNQDGTSQKLSNFVNLPTTVTSLLRNFIKTAVLSASSTSPRTNSDLKSGEFIFVFGSKFKFFYF